jgi:hypothetical protein
MTKFNTLPLVSAQLLRLANDSGYTINLDVEAPTPYLDEMALVLEGFLQSLGTTTLRAYFNDAQMAVIRTFAPFEDDHSLADVLCDSPEVCGIITDLRNVKLFKPGFRLAAEMVNEFMESAFDGAIAEVIVTNADPRASNRDLH